MLARLDSPFDDEVRGPEKTVSTREQLRRWSTKLDLETDPRTPMEKSASRDGADAYAATGKPLSKAGSEVPGIWPNAGQIGN